MSDEPIDSELHNDENGKEVDPGAPIEALADFEHGASVGLLARIRRTIQRRTTTAQLASFSWNAPIAVLVEFLRILIEPLNPKGVRKGRQI